MENPHKHGPLKLLKRKKKHISCFWRVMSAWPPLSAVSTTQHIIIKNPTTESELLLLLPWYKCICINALWRVMYTTVHLFISHMRRCSPDVPTCLSLTVTTASFHLWSVQAVMPKFSPLPISQASSCATFLIRLPADFWFHLNHRAVLLKYPLLKIQPLCFLLMCTTLGIDELLQGLVKREWKWDKETGSLSVNLCYNADRVMYSAEAKS